MKLLQRFKLYMRYYFSIHTIDDDFQIPYMVEVAGIYERVS